MPPNLRRTMTTGAAAAMLILVGGCYEQHSEPTPQPAPQPATVEAPPTPGGTTNQSAARPSHAGARQAAHNTVNRKAGQQKPSFTNSASPSPAAAVGETWTE